MNSARCILPAVEMPGPSYRSRRECNSVPEQFGNYLGPAGGAAPPAAPIRSNRPGTVIHDSRGRAATAACATGTSSRPHRSSTCAARRPADRSRATASRSGRPMSSGSFGMFSVAEPQPSLGPLPFSAPMRLTSVPGPRLTCSPAPWNGVATSSCCGSPAARPACLHCRGRCRPSTSCRSPRARTRRSAA